MDAMYARVHLDTQRILCAILLSWFNLVRFKPRLSIYMQQVHSWVKRSYIIVTRKCSCGAKVAHKFALVD